MSEKTQSGSVSTGKNKGKRKKDKIKNYVRIGTSYYKIIISKNFLGIKIRKLIKWTRQELIDDFGKDVLKQIKKYDGFCVIPNNISYVKNRNSEYNLYSPFPHEFKEGEWKNIKQFLKHIFGKQYTLGLKYFKALLLFPEKILPILVLVSNKRQTGKTTFIDFVMAVFGDNTVMLNSQTFSSNFNGSYASKNIIAIDEAGLDRKFLDEKLKFLSTTKNLPVNEKHIQPYSLPFFGKLIIASNEENSFLKIDSEEIRYFIRKIEQPQKHSSDLLNKMIIEIPQFIFYLKQMPDLDWSKSRQLFTAKELKNEKLFEVVQESKSSVYKELKESLMEMFDNSPKKEIVYASLTDIKDRFFSINHSIDRITIKAALTNEFKFTHINKVTKYKPFDDGAVKTGRPYEITRSYFK